MLDAETVVTQAKVLMDAQLVRACLEEKEGEVGRTMRVW